MLSESRISENSLYRRKKLAIPKAMRPAAELWTLSAAAVGTVTGPVVVALGDEVKYVWVRVERVAKRSR